MLYLQALQIHTGGQEEGLHGNIFRVFFMLDSSYGLTAHFNSQFLLSCGIGPVDLVCGRERRRESDTAGPQLCTAGTVISPAQEIASMELFVRDRNRTCAADSGEEFKPLKPFDPVACDQTREREGAKGWPQSQTCRVSKHGFGFAMLAFSAAYTLRRNHLPTNVFSAFNNCDYLPTGKSS